MKSSRRSARLLCVQLVLCVSLSLLGSLFLLPLRTSDDDELTRSERDLAIFLERLQRVQSKENEHTLNRTATVDTIVRDRFPWLLRNRTEPNAFLFPPPYSESPSRRAVMVLVHVPRAGGGSVVSCWRQVSRNVSLVVSPAMTDAIRSAWDDPSLLTPGFRNAFDAHAGSHAFGLCDQVSRPCSYFALLRHPLERAISSYSHCRQSLGDPQCAAVNANDVTLRDWVLLHGSPFFRSLLFGGHVCSSAGEFNASVLEQEYPLLNPQRPPCWLRHKVWLDALSDDERSVLLEFALANLENWFAVLATTEDMSAAALMFEHVYGLPFSQCDSLNTRNSVVAASVADEATNDVHQQQNAAHQGAPSALPYEDYVELQYDYAVQRALHADYRLYKRVQEITQMQKQILFNKLKS